MKKWLTQLLCVSLFFIFHFSFSNPLWAQGKVTGMVTDARQGTPMEFVNVGIVGQPGGTTTDSYGKYSLTLNSNDSVTLRFSFTGYEPVERRAAAGIQLDVQLRPSTHQLDEVEILDDSRGCPRVVLSVKASTALTDSLGVNEPGPGQNRMPVFHVSLSHDGSVASAVVILQMEDRPEIDGI